MELFEIEEALPAESAPPRFVTAPVLESLPVDLGYVQPAPVVEYVTPTPAVTYASLVEYATPAPPFLRRSNYQWRQQSSQLLQCGRSLRSRRFRKRWRFHCYRPSTRWSIPFCAGRTSSTGTGGTGGDCGGDQDRSACVFRQPRTHASNCPVVDCCVSPHGSDYQVRQEIIGLNHQRRCATGMCSVHSKYTKRPHVNGVSSDH